MEDFPLTITAWTALILGALLLYLTFATILYRRNKHIVLGDGDDKVMTKLIRGHANASEQIPMALILLGLVEYLNGGTYACIIAVILITGRISHAIYFRFDGTTWRFRFYGMLLTLIAQGLSILALLRALLF
ncbi:hypothetical protein F9L33_05555 [Amylibacter sp. SFDW26]|uniref:MAPEG family protein n=1 Tax=Amylibacter sp. SFDW26 TaxID=2652722 RepID=UPI001262A923|nr:MAPEG family protein [Amylibacter sp. SFDW26]KAB7616216.1 hypothetical protein F9L33_05555 [Amylibacter sp. SFDW26]